MTNQKIFWSKLFLSLAKITNLTRNSLKMSFFPEDERGAQNCFKYSKKIIPSQEMIIWRRPLILGKRMSKMSFLAQFYSKKCLFPVRPNLGANGKGAVSKWALKIALFLQNGDDFLKKCSISAILGTFCVSESNRLEMFFFLLKCWICWIMLDRMFQKCASFC